MADILYQDKQVTVCKDLIIINKYYFPLATSRTILFSQIQQVSKVENDTTGPQWGVCSRYLNNWFPYDSERCNKKKFIQIKVRGHDIKPSITPDCPDLVFGLIWEYHTKEGQQYLHKCEDMMKEEEEKRSRKMSENVQEKERKEISDNRNPEACVKEEENKGRKEGKENVIKTEVIDIKNKDDNKELQERPEEEENPLRVINVENM